MKKIQTSVVKTFASLDEAIAHAKEYYYQSEYEYKLDGVIENLTKKSISKVGNGAIILIVDELGLLD